MTMKELEKYRIKLFRDATSMERKPERCRIWQISDLADTDSGYTFTEATHDYEIMEQVMRISP